MHRFLVWRWTCSLAGAIGRGLFHDNNRALLLTCFEDCSDRCDRAGSTLGVEGQRHRGKLSSDLISFEARKSNARARVIVRGSRMEIEALASRLGVGVARWLGDSAVLLANSSQITALAAEQDVLSGDVPVVPFMDVSVSSTAADQVREGQRGLLLGIGAIPGVTGAGITVAVVDSGISAHPALTGKVIASVSKVSGDPSTADAHGHGTHIAGIIAGNSTASKYVTPQYDGGIAPDVKLVNVRVLGANGTGWTSDVIAGIEWVIENRSRYNIRAINLSLGHPVTEPSATDPLCQAVMKASAAGIVVIVSGGNAGKAEDGTPILGGITSPGNSPYAITVGAMNTKATVSRSDDIMTTYSSRGPTKFEHAVKPDVVAPGNKIVSLETPGSYLQRQLPAVPHGGQGHQRLHAPQRHEHVRRGGHGGRRAPDAGASEYLGRSAEDRASDRSDVHERWRVDGRGRRQREFLDEPEVGRERSDDPALDAWSAASSHPPAARCSGTRAP